jgi:hypothetical protein
MLAALWQGVLTAEQGAGGKNGISNQMSLKQNGGDIITQAAL